MTITDDRAIFRAVTDEIYDERLYCATKWANGTVETLNDVDDARAQFDSWPLWITCYLGSWIKGKFPHQYDHDTYLAFRRSMIKVAGLAIQGIMWADRKMQS